MQSEQKSSSVTGDSVSHFGSDETQSYRAYKISRNTGGHYPFIFNDIRGFENLENQGVHVEDFKLALRGHMKDVYQLKPEHQMTMNDPHYEPFPTLDDRVHVLVSVVSARVISIITDEVVTKMREVRLAANDMDIPQLVILTKIDEACSEVKKDINNAYYNEYLREKVELLSAKLGVQANCIFLVKNYNTEGSTNRDIDTLILSALRQMINFGEDYLKDL